MRYTIKNVSRKDYISECLLYNQRHKLRNGHSISIHIMDTQKDISKGHGATPQKSQEIRVYKGHSQNDVIKDNTELSFIISKTEKLTTAVYFLTDFLDVREPLKWELREKAVHFMLLIGTIFNKNSMTWDVSYSPIHKGLNDIVSLLEFLSRLALISEMNTSIMKRE